MRALLTAAVVAALLSGTPSAAHAFAEGAIITAAHSVPDSYVVVLRDGAPMPALSQGAVGRVFTKVLSGFEVTMPATAARRLAAHPSVKYVQQNGTLTVEPFDTQPSPPSWGLDRIDQRNLPLDSSFTYPNTGAGVRAYILSSGIRPTHVDFGGRVVHGQDTIDNDNDATDCNGHGTNVAGIVGGAAHGVAKGVTLVAMRVVNCVGSATFAQVIAGIDWVTANAVKPAVAVMVVGASLDATINNAVRASIASGVSYTVIAGSSNSNACNFSPASVTEAITVAGTTNTDARHSASNFGTCLDLFAPGVGVTTTAWTSDTATVTISGTSFATAHAGGAAALVLAAHPLWTPQQVRDQLVLDATPGVVTNPGTGSPNLLLFVSNSGAPPPCAGTNGTDLSIPDYPAAAVTSSITVAGCSGNASATSSAEVHVIHPFRGDLQIDLIAPDGTAYRLKSRDADSGDDIHTTYLVNVSTESRNGTWGLRLRDRRAANVGHLDTWTLRL